MYESSLVVLEVGFTGRKIDIVVQIPDLIHQPYASLLLSPTRYVHPTNQEQYFRHSLDGAF